MPASASPRVSPPFSIPGGEPAGGSTRAPASVYVPPVHMHTHTHTHTHTGGGGQAHSPGAASGSVYEIVSSPLELLRFRVDACEAAFQAQTDLQKSWRTFTFSAGLLVALHLAIALAAYFTTKRLLLFFVVAALIQFLWAVLRAAPMSSLRARPGLRWLPTVLNGCFCFAYMCATSTEALFIIKPSSAISVGAADSHGTGLVIRPYGQASFEIELGIAMFIVLVPVTLTRVRLSWYLPALAGWLIYYLSMTLVAFPVVSVDPAPHTNLVLWSVVACVLATVCAFRLELLVRMHWYHAAGKSIALAGGISPLAVSPSSAASAVMNDAYSLPWLEPPLIFSCAPCYSARCRRATSCLSCSQASPAARDRYAGSFRKGSAAGEAPLLAGSALSSSSIAYSDGPGGNAGVPMSPLQRALEMLARLHRGSTVSSRDKATVARVMQILSGAATDLLEADYSGLSIPPPGVVPAHDAARPAPVHGGMDALVGSGPAGTASTPLLGGAPGRATTNSLFGYLFRGWLHKAEDSNASASRPPWQPPSPLLAAGRATAPGANAPGTIDYNAGSALYSGSGGDVGITPSAHSAAPEPGTGRSALSVASDLDDATRQWVTSELQTKRAKYARNAPLSRTIVAYDTFGGAAQGSPPVPRPAVLPAIHETTEPPSSMRAGPTASSVAQSGAGKSISSTASSAAGASAASLPVASARGARSPASEVSGDPAGHTPLASTSSFVIRSDPPGPRTMLVGAGRRGPTHTESFVMGGAVGAWNIAEPLLEAPDSHDESSSTDAAAGASGGTAGARALASARSHASLASAAAGVEVVLHRTGSRHFLMPHKSLDRMAAGSAMGSPATVIPSGASPAHPGSLHRISSMPPVDTATGATTSPSDDVRSAASSPSAGLHRVASMRTANGVLLPIPPAAAPVNMFDMESVVRADTLPVGFLPPEAYLRSSAAPTMTNANAVAVQATPTHTDAAMDEAGRVAAPSLVTADTAAHGNASAFRRARGSSNALSPAAASSRDMLLAAGSARPPHRTSTVETAHSNASRRGRRHSDTSAVLAASVLAAGGDGDDGAARVLALTASAGDDKATPGTARHSTGMLGLLSTPLQLFRRSSVDAAPRVRSPQAATSRAAPSLERGMSGAAATGPTPPEKGSAAATPATEAARLQSPGGAAPSSVSPGHTAASPATTQIPTAAPVSPPGAIVSSARVDEDSPSPTPSSGFYVNPKAVAAVVRATERQANAAEESYMQERMGLIARLRGAAKLPGAASSANLLQQPASRPGALQRALPSGVALTSSTPAGAREPQSTSTGTSELLAFAGGSPATRSAVPLTSRTDKDSSYSIATAAPSPPSAPAACGPADRDVAERLRVVTQWEFDVFDFTQRCEGRPLAFISYELFSRFQFFDALGIPETIFTAFINRIERDYCYDPASPNPYHTNVHAADVVQAVGHFLVVPRLAQIMDQVDAFSLIVAAICHDFRHPGVNNNFLIKTQDPIALRYNDESVLENFHSAEAFAVMSMPRYNVLASLAPEQRTAARFTIIRTILATDLAQGGKYVNAFKAKANLPTLGETDEDKLLIMQMMIKCADVSHPARQLHVHNEWSNLVSEEFYKQGDRERAQGLPISPLCDRSQHNLAKSQQGFINFVVAPAFSVFSDFCNVKHWMDQLNANLKHWKDAASAQATVPEGAGAAAPTLAGAAGPSNRSVARSNTLAAAAAARPEPARAPTMGAVGTTAGERTGSQPVGIAVTLASNMSSPAATDVLTLPSLPSFGAAAASSLDGLAARRAHATAPATGSPAADLDLEPHDAVHVEDDDDEASMSAANVPAPVAGDKPASGAEHNAAASSGGSSKQTPR